MGVFISRHAVEQAEAKGYSLGAVREAVRDPDVTYMSHLHPGQRKCIRGDLCVVYDVAKESVVTLFKHLEVTPLRPDQLILSG